MYIYNLMHIAYGDQIITGGSIDVHVYLGTEIRANAGEREKCYT